MSDNTAPQALESDDSSTEQEPGQATETNSDEYKNKFESAVASRDKAKAKARELQAKLNEYEQKEALKQKETAEQSGDIETLKAHFTETLTKEKQTVAELQAKLNKVLVETQVKDLAAKHMRDPEIYWKMRGENYGLGDNDSPVLKTNEFVTPLEDITEFLSQREYLRINPLKAGVGAQAPTGKSEKAKSVPENFGSMTRAEQAQFFRDNPDLVNEATKKILG